MTGREKSKEPEPKEPKVFIVTGSKEKTGKIKGGEKGDVTKGLFYDRSTKTNKREEKGGKI